jgi:hypothetical protein
MKWSIEDFVYGATNGAVTTFAVVAGVIGASLSPSVVLTRQFAYNERPHTSKLVR